MEGFPILLVMAFLILTLGVAAVAFGVDSRDSFADERFRPSFE